MKKSSYVALLLGFVAILLLGIGMCMCLLPQWNAFQQGIVVGCAGLFTIGIDIFAYRKMEHKSTISCSKKTIGSILLIILGVLMLGCGMSITMVYEEFLLGIIIGCIGILVLVASIPLLVGIKE